MDNIILEMKEITKEFPGVKALDDVSFILHKGEVLALLGENGAGKSTLLKILSGVYIADKGNIILEGKTCNFTRPVDGYEAGISIIHQELNYLDELTIGENIFLGRLPKKNGLIDWKKIEVESKKALEKVGFKTSPKRLMKELKVSEKQLVEIAKAVSRNMKVLVMDEPTSALNNEEVRLLLDLIKKIKKEGIGVVYISHKLKEIFDVADNIQVLRDGKSVAYYKTSEINEEQLIAAMVGRDISVMYPKEKIQLGKVIFEVENLCSPTVSNISFNLRAGEILGVFGLMGAGRNNMAETIFGKQQMTSGKIRIHGKEIVIRSPRDAKCAGIGYVPAERKKEGLILSDSVERNISTATIKLIKKNFLLSRKIEQKNALHWVEKFRIKTPSIKSIVNTLSGGNQQKVVLAKWLQASPKVLILNEPTRGIDVGAKVEIYKLMEELCKQGMGVIMISSELLEVIALSDRVVVMAGGTVVGEVSNREEMTQENLMNYAIQRKEVF